MFKEKIILAQTDEVLENLVNSETKFQELNQRLGEVQAEYAALSQTAEPMSFFNFENVYFWIVVCGLLILAFGWWYLLVELKSNKSKTKKEKIKKPKTKKIEIEEPEPVAAPSKPRRAFKVRVRKVK
jgi:hypothetical protein